MTVQDLPFIAEGKARLERLEARMEDAERAWMRALASHSKSRRLWKQWCLLKARYVAMQVRYG